jgi:hypothetical protein
MANPYEGKSGMANLYEEKPNRFRQRYRELTDEEQALHDQLKDKAAELEALFDQVKDGRYKSLAYTSLEQSVMWIVKELTS